MDESDLQVFIDGVLHYFKQTSKQSAIVDTPYLVSTNEPVVSEFTGIIGISGRRKGSVYFTAPRPMLERLLIEMGEPESDEAYLCDLCGEVANTLSGNARKAFGKEFMISVPVVIMGEPAQIMNPKDLRSFVIPVTWNDMQAFLVICLE